VQIEDLYMDAMTLVVAGSLCYLLAWMAAGLLAVRRLPVDRGPALPSTVGRLMSWTLAIALSAPAAIAASNRGRVVRPHLDRSTSPGQSPAPPWSISSPKTHDRGRGVQASRGTPIVLRNPPAPPWAEPHEPPPPRSRGSDREAAGASSEERDRGSRELNGVHVTGTHRVRQGENLWNIAALVLNTSDATRIAGYWPLIHRLNRAVVGSNPNLIFPGQLLNLPAERPVNDKSAGRP
jgi:nucleoid-associated protein YgaU